MIRNLVAGLGVAAAMVVGTSAHAEADNRWYATGMLGVVVSDDDNFSFGPAARIGGGKFLNRWLGVELDAIWSSEDTDSDHSGRHYEKYGLSANALLYILDGSIRPYVVGGLNGLHVRFGDATTYAPGGEVGVGALWLPNNFPVGIRGDLRYQVEVHRNNEISDDDVFYEWVAAVGALFPFGGGSEATPDAPPPPPPVIAPAPTPAVAPTLAPVTFPLDSAVLTMSAKATLDSVGAVLSGNPDMMIDVVGHADESGPASYNLRLSEQRAQAVKAYLVSQGVDASRLTVRAVGEEQPRADNGTTEGRSLNRRVEFEII